MEAARMAEVEVEVEAEEGLIDYETALKTSRRSRSSPTTIAAGGGGSVVTIVEPAMEENGSQQGEEPQRSIYFEKHENGDIESNDTTTEEKPQNEKWEFNIENGDGQDGLVTVNEHNRDGNLKDVSLYDLHLLEPVDNRLEEHAAVTLSKHRGQEITELEVERVIKEQETHDLICPNCNSCITKRVILRKRKRTAEVHYDPKREKTGIGVNSGGTNTDTGGVTKPVVDTSPTPVDSNTGLDIFRCLSCLTYFFGPGVNSGGTNTKSGGVTEPVVDTSPTPVDSNTRPDNSRCLSCLTYFFGPGVNSGGTNTKSGGVTEPVVDTSPTPIDSNTGVNLGGTNTKSGGVTEPVVDTSPTHVDSNTDDVAGPTVIDMPEVPPVTGRTHEWDILKCIVYGGLIESITSLGIVSSAVASDATTLNVVILGLANLMSGLIIIIHNIREMMNDQHEATGEVNPKIDRYQETLGRRANYPMHAIFAVMSYLVFGLLPPIIYGFSFRESNDKLYKLIATGTASLVSVLLLSVGKAHVQRPPKPYLKTIMYYLLAAVSGSGLCYAVGLLLQRLIEKTDWFDTSSTPSTVFLETRAMKSGGEFYR